MGGEALVPLPAPTRRHLPAGGAVEEAVVCRRGLAVLSGGLAVVFGAARGLVGRGALLAGGVDQVAVLVDVIVVFGVAAHVGFVVGLERIFGELELGVELLDEAPPAK